MIKSEGISREKDTKSRRRKKGEKEKRRGSKSVFNT